MPELKSPFGYYGVVNIMALICSVLYWRFRKNGWLQGRPSAPMLLDARPPLLQHDGALFISVHAVDPCQRGH